MLRVFKIFFKKQLAAKQAYNNKKIQSNK